MKKFSAQFLLALAVGGGVFIAAPLASADESLPTELIPTSSTLLTYDSESELLVTIIDEQTIEVSRPD